MKWLVLATLGGALLVIAPWVVARLGRRYGQDDVIETAIKAPTYRHVGADEGLQARSRQRRDAADRIRARAAAVESGAKVADVLRLAQRS